MLKMHLFKEKAPIMEKQLSCFSHTPSAAENAANQWIAKIDGAARGNPGLAGAGVVIEYANKIITQKGIFLGEKTNNQAEYLALAYAIFLIKEQINELEKNTLNQGQIKLVIYSDSELLVRQMNKVYKVKNSDLAKIKKNIDSALQGIHSTFIHVPRENNTKADKLANIAIDNKTKLPADFLKILIDCGLSC
jgi:ribonuclease HI